MSEELKKKAKEFLMTRYGSDSLNTDALVEFASQVCEQREKEADTLRKQLGLIERYDAGFRKHIETLGIVPMGDGADVHRNARAEAAELALQTYRDDFQNREAAVCPEDVGFEEFIASLKKAIDRLEDAFVAEERHSKAAELALQTLNNEPYMECSTCSYKVNRGEWEAVKRTNHGKIRCPGCGGYPGKWQETEVSRLKAALQATEQELAQLSFIIEVLRYSVTKDLSFHWYLKDGQLIPCANCSDCFWWGTADGEAITPDNFTSLKQTVAECESLEQKVAEGKQYPTIYSEELFAARIRKMRPQGASYEHYPAIMRPLFDACGPERETGFGNPHKQPAADAPSKNADRAPTYEELQSELAQARQQAIAECVEVAEQAGTHGASCIGCARLIAGRIHGRSLTPPPALTKPLAFCQCETDFTDGTPYCQECGLERVLPPSQKEKP